MMGSSLTSEPEDNFLSCVHVGGKACKGEQERFQRFRAVVAGSKPIIMCKRIITDRLFILFCCKVGY